MRSWSLLFLLTSLACVGLFGYAAISPDWWLTPNVSTRGSLAFGGKVDHLLIVVLGITGAVFVITQLALAWVLWRYGAPRKRRVIYSHGNNWLEAGWTIIPAAILIFLGVYQYRAWAEIKFRGNQPGVPLLAEVTGSQFYWAIRYPGADAKLGTDDDLHAVNSLHVVKGPPVLIHLKASDVIHSFFLPSMRIKQDALPGHTLPVWFDVDEPGEYELVCAELCGWGHTRMRATITVHEDQASYDAWFQSALAEQNRSQLDADSETDTTTGDAAAGDANGG